MEPEIKRYLDEYDAMEQKMIQEEFERDHSQKIQDIEARVGGKTIGPFLQIVELINKPKEEKPFHDYH